MLQFWNIDNKIILHKLNIYTYNSKEDNSLKYNIIILNMYFIINFTYISVLINIWQNLLIPIKYNVYTSLKNS